MRNQRLELTRFRGHPMVGAQRSVQQEVLEVGANPEDLEEWIDIVLFALDGAWRSVMDLRH